MQISLQLVYKRTPYKQIIMRTFIVLAAVLVAVSCMPKSNKEPTPEELSQNKNAHYHFETVIEDKISGLAQQRTEHRDGLKAEGYYTYSDGFFTRTVNYVADENGYRVISQKVVELSGPKVNQNGVASVDVHAHGNQIKYKIQSVPTPDGKTKIVDLTQ